MFKLLDIQKANEQENASKLGIEVRLVLNRKITYMNFVWCLSCNPKDVFYDRIGNLSQMLLVGGTLRGNKLGMVTHACNSAPCKAVAVGLQVRGYVVTYRNPVSK